MIEAIIGLLKTININFLSLAIALAMLLSYLIWSYVPLWMLIIGIICGIYFFIVVAYDYHIKIENEKFEKEEERKRQLKIDDERRYKEERIRMFFEGLNDEKKKIFAKVITTGRPDSQYNNVRFFSKSDRDSCSICFNASNISRIHDENYMSCNLITIEDIGSDEYIVTIDDRLLKNIQKYKGTCV